MLINGPVFTAALVNNGLSFDGANDYVRIDTGPTIEIGLDYTDSAALVLDVGTGSIRGWIHTGGSRQGEITTAGNFINYRDDARHFVGCTYDGATSRLYVDGGLVGSLAASGTIDSAPYGMLGQHQYPVPDNGHKFGGVMDEVTVYDRALSAAEITAEFIAGSDGKCQPVCGNDALEVGEDCDNGAANSDTDAGACRADLFITLGMLLQ